MNDNVVYNNEKCDFLPFQAIMNGINDILKGIVKDKKSSFAHKPPLTCFI